jgi:hypothetical protein
VITYELPPVTITAGNAAMNFQPVSADMQWGRRCTIMIGKNDPTGKKSSPYLTVSDLRVTFEILKTIDKTPNSAKVSIYNLTDQHTNLIKKDYDEVIMMAGYQAADQMLFRGTIRHAYSYQESGTDWITYIDAGDGDKDYQQAVISKTLAAGHTDNDWLNECGKAFLATGGTKLGHMDVKGRARVRGRTYVGLTRDLITQIAKASDAHWSIQDGVLQIVAVDTTLPNQAIKIASNNGLLGAPEVTDKGITVKCLLRPALKVQGKIWIDNNNVRERARKASIYHKGGPLKPLTRLDVDGVYKNFKVLHRGDTRGNSGEDWCSEVQCVGLTDAIPKLTGATPTKANDMMDSMPEGAEAY